MRRNTERPKEVAMNVVPKRVVGSARIKLFFLVRFGSERVG